MQVPLELTTQGIEEIRRKDIEGLVEEQVAKLERVCNHIISCHVAIEKPQKHQQSGSPYRIRVDVRIPPNQEVVVKRDTNKGNIHDSLPSIIREVFQTIRRQVQKLVDKEHNKVKFHEEKKPPSDLDDISEYEGELIN